MTFVRWVVISALAIFWPGLVAASFPATETTTNYPASQTQNTYSATYQYIPYMWRACGLTSTESSDPSAACSSCAGSKNYIYSYTTYPNATQAYCWGPSASNPGGSPINYGTAGVFCPSGYVSTGTNCRSSAAQCNYGDTVSGAICYHTEYSCNSGDVLSGQTCTHIEYSCPSGATLSGSSCDWSPCPNITDTQDPATGQCTPAPPDCPEGQVDADPNTPGSQCYPASCSEGQTDGDPLTPGAQCVNVCQPPNVYMGELSTGGPNCGIPPTCQSPKVDVDPSLARALCVEPLTCPDGQNDTDPDPIAVKCVQNPDCPDGYVDINPNPATADCRAVGCPPGTHDSDPDPLRDWCIGDPQCGPGTHYEDGQCKNDNGSYCPPGTYETENGSCRPNDECQPGTHLSGNSCVPDVKQCPPGTQPNASGACEALPPSCPPGTEWNGARCADPNGNTPPPPTDEESHGCSYGTHWNGTQCAAGDPAGCTAGSHWTGSECGVNECGDGAWGLNPCSGSGTGGGTGGDGSGGSTGGGGTGGSGGGLNTGTDSNGDGKIDGLDTLNDDLLGIHSKLSDTKVSIDRVGENSEAIKKIIERIENGPDAKDLSPSSSEIIQASGPDGVGGTLQTMSQGLDQGHDDGSKLRVFNLPSLEVGTCGAIDISIMGRAIPIDLQAGLNPLKVILYWYLTIMSAWWLFDIVSEPSGGKG